MYDKTPQLLEALRAANQRLTTSLTQAIAEHAIDLDLLVSEFEADMTARLESFMGRGPTASEATLEPLPSTLESQKEPHDHAPDPDYTHQPEHSTLPPVLEGLRPSA